METCSRHRTGRQALALLKASMAMYCARGCAVPCCADLGMCHAALECAVLHCVVDQVVLGIRFLAELIWILNSSCHNLWLAQSWPQSKRAGRSTSSSSRSDSVAKRGEARGANPNRSQTHRQWTDRNAANQGNISRHLHWAMGSSNEEDIDGDGTVPGAALRCAGPCSQTLHETQCETAHETPYEAFH